MNKTRKVLGQSVCMSFAMIVAISAPVLAADPPIVTAFKDNFLRCTSAMQSGEAFAALENLKRLSSDAIAAGHDNVELKQMYQADIKDCTNIAEALGANSPIVDERAQRVLSEAYQACLDLEKKDEIAARTNQFCHRLFLLYKYR